MNFKEIVASRYAVKSFNGESIPEDKIGELKEMMLLAPTSFNLQPWKVQIVKDTVLKEKLKPVSWNQPQITTSSHVFVICANTDLDALAKRLEKRMLEEGGNPEKSKMFMGMIWGFLHKLDEPSKLIWAQRQAYIALSHGMNGAKALGFDSCPIEGFDPDAYSEILALPENLVPTVVMPVGYASDSPRPKLRFYTEEMFF